MTREELRKVLDGHKKWLNGEGGKRADLSIANMHRADLRHVDLRHVDMRGANIHRADMHHADMRGANLDYSCWPLWCGSLNAHIDTRIAVQLLYHLMRPCLVSEGVDEDFKKALFTPELIAWANTFHRVRECGEIEWPKEETK